MSLKSDTSVQRMTIRSIVFSIIVLILLPSLSMIGVEEVRAADCCVDPITGGKGTILNLEGSDPDSGDLTKDYPSGGYESVMINPGLGLVRQELGYWESEPLIYDWTVASLIKFQIPAWGNGYSANTEFFIEVFAGGDSQGEVATANVGMMPHYMYWLANDTYSFTLRAGETFAIRVSVEENGPGGAKDIPGHEWVQINGTVVYGLHYNRGPDNASQWWSSDADNDSLLYVVSGIIDEWTEEKSIAYAAEGYQHYHELVKVSDGTSHPTMVIWLRHYAVMDFTLDGGPAPGESHSVTMGIDMDFIPNYDMEYTP